MASSLYCKELTDITSQSSDFKLDLYHIQEHLLNVHRRVSVWTLHISGVSLDQAYVKLMVNDLFDMIFKGNSWPAKLSLKHLSAISIFTEPDFLMVFRSL